MSAFNLSGKSIVTSPVLAVSMYAGLVAALVFVAVSSIADILAQRQDVASVSTMLEQLEGRRPTARPAWRQSASWAACGDGIALECLFYFLA